MAITIHSVFSGVEQTYQIQVNLCQTTCNQFVKQVGAAPKDAYPFLIYDTYGKNIANEPAINYENSNIFLKRSNNSLNNGVTISSNRNNNNEVDVLKERNNTLENTVKYLLQKLKEKEKPKRSFITVLLSIPIYFIFLFLSFFTLFLHYLDIEKINVPLSWKKYKESFVHIKNEQQHYYSIFISWLGNK